MNRRVLIAIGLVLVAVIILVVALVSLRVQEDTAAPPPETTEDGTPLPPGEADVPPGEAGTVPLQPLPEMIEVVVSIQTLPRGWQLTEAELTTDMRIATEVGSNVVTSIQDAVGLYARTDIFQGESLTYDALVVDPTILGANEFGPSSLIPPGFVAAAVPMDRLSGVAYGLKEGDSIDIMVSYYLYEIDEEFQTYLENAAQIFLADEEGNEVIILLSPIGRFEELATGDLAQVAPRESQRPTLVSIILQNAKVIQVGNWSPPDAVTGPTPTPEPTPEGGDEEEAQPTVGPPLPSPTPLPDVMLVALSPQQQLVMKYALESDANIDYALRPAQDNQLYSVEPVDLNYVLNRFGIEVPPNFDYTIDTLIEEQDVTATPVPQDDTGEGS